jgi:hypothetical protein
MGTGVVITVSELDSVRIERPDGTSLQIPAAFITAIDRVLRHCAADESSLDLDMVEDDDTGWQGWEAYCDNPAATETLSMNGNELLVGHGDTPWGAVVALAMALNRVE